MPENEDLQPFRIDALTAGGLGAPAGTGPAAAPPGGLAPGERGDAGYPTIESIISKRKNFEEFQARAQQTVTRLGELVQNGTPEQKQAAARALRAYEHLGAMLERAVALTLENIKRMKAQRAGR